MFNHRRIAAIGALMAGCVALAAPADAQPAPTAMTCTNPASGTTWQIRIDYVRKTVDGYPASIGGSVISWFDPKDNGTYTLFRSTGKLRFIGSSSTGGYSVFDRCRPATP